MLSRVRKAVAISAVSAAFVTPAAACGVEPYVGEVCMFAINYCPVGYAQANGQLLPINQYQELFALLGTYFGGDGINNFALPDLQGRAPVGTGAGAGLGQIVIGQQGGAEEVQLTTAQMPSHTHKATVLPAQNTTVSRPGPTVMETALQSTTSLRNLSAPTTNTITVNISPTGGNQPVGVRDPYVGMTYCIAVTGNWPPRP